MLLSRVYQRVFKRTQFNSLRFERVKFSGNAVDLSYTCYGRESSMTPVVILHGLFASKDNWSSVGETIHRTTGRRVINVDARNHGASQHTSEHTYVNMAQDTVNLIRKLGLTKVMMLGHSMGGKTAMVVSLLHPEQISKLIIVDTSPMSSPEKINTMFPKVLGCLAPLSFEGLTTVEEAKRYAEEKLRAIKVTQKDVIDFILNNVGITPDKTVGWICNMNVLYKYIQILLKFPHTHTSARIFAGPTLFIGAEHTGFIPLQDKNGIKNYFPQAQIKYMKRVGHNIHENDPSTFLKITTEFLQKHIS